MEKHFIQILSRFFRNLIYPNFIQILSWFYLDKIRIKSGLNRDKIWIKGHGQAFWPRFKNILFSASALRKNMRPFFSFLIVSNFMVYADPKFLIFKSTGKETGKTHLCVLLCFTTEEKKGLISSTIINRHCAHSTRSDQSSYR